MASDININGNGVRIRVEGLRKTIRHMEQAGVASQDMKILMHEVGLLVVKAAAPPRDSGRLATTIRAGRGKTKAVVRAGGAKAPYAGVIHYGWPARNIAPNPFLVDAMQRRRTAVLSRLDQGIDELLEKNDLK